MKLSSFIGKSIDSLLEKKPFSDWNLEKSLDDEGEELVYHYVFIENGLEVRCNEDLKICVIFINSSEYGGFKEEFEDAPLTSEKSEVINGFGAPTMSGGPVDHPILGRSGAWDLFVLDDFAIHFQYKIGSEKIERITIMNHDSLPYQED